MTHKVIGEGYMKIPNGDSMYSEIHSGHTSTMPRTIISPGDVVHCHKKFRVSNCDNIMNTQSNNKKAFTLTLVFTSSTSNMNTVQDEVNYMTDDGLQKNWHQLLCHTHNKCVKDHGDMRKDANMVGQGLSLGWGFMVQKSKNQERTQKLTSIDSSKSYLLVVDHYSN
eukprot:11260851-Ditylum_brightwellii.AAC.1